MTDYKHVTAYPVECTSERDRRRSHIADILVATVASIGLGYWIGSLGENPRKDEASPIPAIVTCPQNNPDQDVIEHTWSHRGHVIHRECLIVSKPIYAAPRYRAFQRHSM